MDDCDPPTPQPGRGLDDITPTRGGPPDQLSAGDVRRIERLLGRPARNVELALAEQYRRGSVPLEVIVAQLTVDLHDVRRPVGWAVKIGMALLAGVLGGALYVGNAIWGTSQRNTEVEYRLRDCERAVVRVKALEDLLYRPAYPVAGQTRQP